MAWGCYFERDSREMTAEFWQRKSAERQQAGWRTEKNREINIKENFLKGLWQCEQDEISSELYPAQGLVLAMFTFLFLQTELVVTLLPLL